MVRKSVLFSNVIVDIAFPRRPFVFSQSLVVRLLPVSPMWEACQSEQLIL